MNDPVESVDMLDTFVRVHSAEINRACLGTLPEVIIDYLVGSELLGKLHHRGIDRHSSVTLLLSVKGRILQTYSKLRYLHHSDCATGKSIRQSYFAV